MLRFLSAGESHGEALVGILEGMPAGLKIEIAKINAELKRRQQGYGRGPRMKIESDKARVLSGLRKSVTIGSPIAVLINNKDNSIDKQGPVSSPRPGHADLAGVLKYGFNDARSVLERASARETAIRVAIGAICKTFLNKFKIDITSRVLLVGGEFLTKDIKKKIDLAKRQKDTLGGILEVKAINVPAGFGSYVQWDRRLNAQLALACMSVPGIKSVEFGLGSGFAYKFGSDVHDAIYYEKGKGFYRKTNNAGGLEGGMSNGEDIIIRCCMKPITTLGNPLDSVNLGSKKKTKASVQRADICAIEAAGVVAEGMVSFALTESMLEKFGQDNMQDILKSFATYVKRIS